MKNKIKIIIIIKIETRAKYNVKGETDGMSL